jgi:hypothetical protein
MSGKNSIRNLNLLPCPCGILKDGDIKESFILDKISPLKSVEIERTGAAESSLNPDDVVLVLQCSERLMLPKWSLKDA